MEDITEKPIFALEEQLARQKGILANSSLLKNLPDKGEKLRASVVKIEAELERRKKELVTQTKEGSNVPDVEKLEWVLRSTGLSFGGASSGSSSRKQVVNTPNKIDSDDDEEMSEEKNEESTLKLIATSQITQRQDKPVLIACNKAPEPGTHAKSRQKLAKEIQVKADPYVVKLVEQDIKKAPSDTKFIPAKSVKKKAPGNDSPVASVTSEGSASSNASGSGKHKWDEALLPPQSGFDGVKLLSMEDTMKISCDKYKQAEVMKATAPPKKTYAYDKLKQQGLLGSYNVAMQTSRPVRPDMSDDEVDGEESDLSHDSITDDSESEEEGDDNERKSDKSRDKDKTSKDLSGILNQSLKIS